MSRIPHRQPLPNQAAEIIRELIAAGEIRNLLPGERTLASQLQIGRDTLRAALNILESDGLISERKHGKRREILSHEIRKPTSTRRVAFLSPKTLVQLPPWMMVEFDILRELLNKRSYDLQLTSPGLFHLKNPAKKLESMLKDIDADAWILYQCPPQVQQWFANKGIPTLIRGYPHPGIHLPFLDEDWEAAAFHAGTLLKRNGHQRVLLLMPQTNLAGLKATEAGLRKAFPDSDGLPAVIPATEKGNATSVGQTLGRILRLNQPPSAVVTTRSRHTLSIISWMGQHKLSIPDDLSLITLASEPWYEHLIPKPTHYFSDPQSVARTVLRSVLPIAEEQSPGSTEKLLIPEYFPGQTVAKI